MTMDLGKGNLGHRFLGKLFSRLRRFFSGKYRLPIRQKMTLILLSMSIVTFVALSAVAFYGMIGTRDMAIRYSSEIGRQSDLNSSHLMAEQRTDELISIAADKADDIDHRLKDMEDDVRLATVSIKKILEHPGGYSHLAVGGPPPTGGSNITFYVQYGPNVDANAFAGEIALAGNIRDTLVGIIECNPLIDCIFVASNQNFTLSADNYLDIPPEEYEPPELHYDAVASDWYRLAESKHDLVFTPVRQFVFSKKLGIFCAQPYYDSAGRLAGVACLEATLDSLNKLVNEVDLRNEGFCFVIDEGGHVILSSARDASDPESELGIDLQADRRLSENEGLSRAVADMVRGGESMTEVIIDGDKYYVAYSPINETGWSFAAAITEESAMATILKNNADINQLTERNIKEFNSYMMQIMVAMVALVVVMLLVAIVFGRKMSERFVGPIHVLSDGVREIASGNLQKKINIDTGDEIEHLAVCFNAMTDSLKDYMENLALASAERERQNDMLRRKNAELTQALHDVERLRIARDNYRAESEIDKLTQLYNKAATERICGEWCNSLPTETKAALYLIDLDHFKEANDTRGHQYGDLVLKEFALHLKLICRAEDCVGRFGGDEFVVMMTGALTEEIVLAKAKLMKQAAQELLIDGEPSIITASIGIAIAPTDGKDYETLFKAADRALYRVKEAGRNDYQLAASGDR